MIQRTDQKLNLLLIFTFYYKYQKYKIIYILGLIFNMKSYQQFCWSVKSRSEIAATRGNLLTYKQDKAVFAFLSVSRQLAWCD